MDMIVRLKSYRNGVHGDFFLDVADELETQQKLAAFRLEQVLRVVRGEFAQICSYCGWEAQAGGASWEQLQSHIAECDEHPVKKLSDKVSDLERRLYLESELYNQEHLRRVAAERALPKWTSCAEVLPDSDTTVMTYAPGSSEPIWPGYHDGEMWVDLLGAPIVDAPVVAWMHFPDAPSSLARALGDGEVS